MKQIFLSASKVVEYLEAMDGELFFDSANGALIGYQSENGPVFSVPDIRHRLTYSLTEEEGAQIASIDILEVCDVNRRFSGLLVRYEI